LSNERRIRTETALPQAVTEDEDMVVPWLILACEERSTQLRGDSEDRKIVR
jgi:hypothetical protein